MLFDGWGGGAVALDVARDDHGIQLRQVRHAAPVAPVEELPRRLTVGAAGVLVTDARREELKEAKSRFLTGGGDQGREAVEARDGQAFLHI